MRKRHQNGIVRKIHGSWSGRYYENGRRRALNLGRATRIFTKSDAETKLSKILEPINARVQRANPSQPFGDFVENIFFPLKKEGWKGSTAMTTPDRIRRHLLPGLETRKLGEIS